MSGSITKSLLIITGTMGAGKTSVLGKASDMLTPRYIAHAAIDVDALGLAYLPAASGNDEVMYGNLRSVCDNYASIGVTRFLLARALESRAELELYRGMVLATNTVVCRLAANIETMERRVKQRESGGLGPWYAKIPDLSSDGLGKCTKPRLRAITATC